MWPQLPWARLDEPSSKVRQLTLPFLQMLPASPGLAGSYQAPSQIRTTP